MLLLNSQFWYFLFQNVPDDASKLADFQKIIKCTSDFEESLKELMFIASSDGKDERLSKFADNVEVHFASRKKVEILAKARNLLLQSDFRLPEVSTKCYTFAFWIVNVLAFECAVEFFLQDGTRRHSKVKDDKKAERSSDLVVDLLFTSERCVVSEAGLGLMKVVHRTLKVSSLKLKKSYRVLFTCGQNQIVLLSPLSPLSPLLSLFSQLIGPRFAYFFWLYFLYFSCNN